MYLKLIALKIDDLASSIFFEDNYSLEQMGLAQKDKAGLEKQGYACLLVKTTSSLVVTC